MFLPGRERLLGLGQRDIGNDGAVDPRVLDEGPGARREGGVVRDRRDVEQIVDVEEAVDAERPQSGQDALVRLRGEAGQLEPALVAEVVGHHDALEARVADQADPPAPDRPAIQPGQAFS